jgi:hypothetical protein
MVAIVKGSRTGLLRSLSDVLHRLLELAVKAAELYPFVNPARAALSSVRLDGQRYVIQGVSPTIVTGQNAVFLTTGVVTECALVTPVASWTSAAGQVGPLVKRIRIRPFVLEYERTVAFFGNYLDIGDTNSFGGPVYNNGLGFTTRKDNARKGDKFIGIVHAKRTDHCLSVPESRFLASTPTKTGIVSKRKQNLGTSSSRGGYPDCLRFDDDGRSLHLEHAPADFTY